MSASRVLKNSKFSATFHCLSYSYPLSKCKCNERVLHLSDVAMHVDTCLPQPFLHCPLHSAMFARMTSILLLCFMWDCPSKPPPSLSISLLFPEHLFVPHIIVLHTAALAPPVQPWRCSSTNFDITASEGCSVASPCHTALTVTALTIVFQL